MMGYSTPPRAVLLGNAGAITASVTNFFEQFLPIARHMADAQAQRRLGCRLAAIAPSNPRVHATLRPASEGLRPFMLLPLPKPGKYIGKSRENEFAEATGNFKKARRLGFLLRVL